MTEEVLYRRNTTLIRRQLFGPGESTPWHRDLYHRVTVVLSGDALTIEYRDGSPDERLSVRPGQVDWDEPTNRVHRGVNVGQEPYEEIAIFFLDRADADPQPLSKDDSSVLVNPAPEPRGVVRDHSALVPIGDRSNGGPDIEAVSAVVRDGGQRILLIKTAEAGWELPGGKVEPGEDFISALVREVREETGCEIEIGRLTGITVNTAMPRTTILTFLCRHKSGEPHPGDDSLEAGWFASDTAIQLVTHPVEQLRLEDALGADEHVVYRAYRRVANEGSRHGTFEMLGVHRC